jgi:transposase
MKGPMDCIRYSEAFKMRLVREVEMGPLPLTRVARKYGVKSHATLIQWVRRYGSGKLGKVIRVETPDEQSELARLKKENKNLKEALAHAHVDLMLEKAYLEVACDRLNQSVEGFKKKNDGKRRGKRSG